LNRLNWDLNVERPLSARTRAIRSYAAFVLGAADVPVAAGGRHPHATAEPHRTRVAIVGTVDGTERRA